MKRLGFIFALLFLTAYAQAQFSGYSSPQAVMTKIMSGATAPLATPASFTANCVPSGATACSINNMGQTVHLVIYTTSATSGTIRCRLEFSYDNAVWAPMSPDATDVPGTTTPAAIFATGIFPFVRLNLLNISGGISFTAFYSGTSATTLASTSLFNASQQYKQLVGFQQAENASFSQTIPVPFGSSGGTIWFVFSGAPGSAADTFSISCGPDGASANQLSVFTQTLNQVSGLRTFVIGSVPCSEVIATFTPGGGASGVVTWSAWYQFTTPNVPSNTIAGTASPPTQQVEPFFACEQNAPVSISNAGAQSNQLLSGSGNEIIRVCHLSISCTAAQSIKLQQGTGTNCGTGTVDKTGTYPAQINFALNLDPNYSLRLGAGQALCVNFAAAATCGGLVTFTKF